MVFARIGSRLPSLGFGFLLSVVLALTACSDTADIATIELKATHTIAIAPDRIIFTDLNATRLARINAVDVEGNVIGIVLDGEWSSSNPAVAQVSSDGVITAVSAGVAQIMVKVGEKSDTITVVVDITRYQLSGVMTYQDKVYSHTGFTGALPSKPVRYAVVDLLDSATGNIVQTTSTTVSGSYQFTNVVRNDYTIRLLAMSDGVHQPVVAIKDRNNALYSVTVDVPQTELTSTFSIDVSTALLGGGAFNMLDVFTAGMEFVQANDSSGLVMPELDVTWPGIGTYTCSAYDSTYCPRGAGIHVLGSATSPSDTDDFDDDVLLHEFGHFIEQAVGLLDSPGGQHSLTDNTLDLRLAWSEGLGNYMSGAIKKWIRSNRPLVFSMLPSEPDSLYVDTLVSGVGVSIDFAAPTGSSSFYYASNEAAVAKVLHKLEANRGFAAIWQVFSTYLGSNHGHWQNMESFWDGWLNNNNDAALASDRNVLLERKIYYVEDAFEVDDSMATAPVQNCSVAGTCYSQQHYLFKDAGAADIDYLAVDVLGGNSYQIETSGMYNGADTNLAVYDGTGVLLAENDDAYYPTSCTNTAYNFASKVVVTPAVDERIYVAVDTSPEYAECAGRYGTYTLKVTQQ